MLMQTKSPGHSRRGSIRLQREKKKVPVAEPRFNPETIRTLIVLCPDIILFGGREWRIVIDERDKSVFLRLLEKRA